MEASNFSDAFTRRSSYFCRIRTMNNEDLYRELDVNGSKDLLERSEIFDLPIYNEYFILEFGNADQVIRAGQEEAPPPPAPQ